MAINKPKNSGGFRFVGKQCKRLLRKRGEACYYDFQTGFFVWSKKKFLIGMKLI